MSAMADCPGQRCGVTQHIVGSQAHRDCGKQPTANVEGAANAADLGQFDAGALTPDAPERDDYRLIAGDPRSVTWEQMAGFLNEGLKTGSADGDDIAGVVNWPTETETPLEHFGDNMSDWPFPATQPVDRNSSEGWYPNLPQGGAMNIDYDGSGLVTFPQDNIDGVVEFNFGADGEEMTSVPATFFETGGTPIDAETGDDLEYMGADLSPDVRAAIEPFAGTVSKPEILYGCGGCGTDASWTGADAADAGTPICGECGDDMESNGIQIRFTGQPAD